MGEGAVGVIEDGDAVVMARRDSLVVEGVSGSVGPLGDAKVIREEGTGRVVGVSDDTDDVSGWLTVDVAEGSEIEGAGARSRSGSMGESVQRVNGDKGASGTLGADTGVRMCSRLP